MPEWPGGARAVSCPRQAQGKPGRRNQAPTLVLAHVRLVGRLVEVLTVLQGGTHACASQVRIDQQYQFFSELPSFCL